MFLGDDWSRDDVAGIPFTDEMPHKRRVGPPGADIRGDANVTCFYQGRSTVRGS